MKRSSLVLVAVTVLAVVGTSPYSLGQSQNQAPHPARSRADETLDMRRGAGQNYEICVENKLVHNSYTWMSTIERSGEHYGQLVVYYRANNLVPPDSRR